MNTKKTRPEVKNYTNPFEGIKDIGTGVTRSLVDDVGKDSVTALWNQLLGAETTQSQTEGELSEGQELDLRTLSKQQAKSERSDYRDIDPGINYIREIVHGGEKVTSKELNETKAQIQEIQIELQKLITTSSELKVEFKEMTVQSKIEKPGKYHVNFFVWVLSIVKAARMRVEDSANWLALFKSKKAQKSYWNMFKKHGTTFGLSNERVVATQTG